MSFESDRFKFRLAVDIFIAAAKAKKLGLLFEIILQCLVAKISWDIGMQRLTGEFYQKQVEQAAEKFKGEHPEEFKCDTSGVEGFNKWQETMKKP